MLAAQFEATWPVRSWRDCHVLLAVSAGPDSVAMLRAGLALRSDCPGRGRIFVGHFNHQLRGGDADADEAWLKVLCERLNVPLEVGRADGLARDFEQGDGWEAGARAARYEFLRNTAERLGARFVATAHTADDQVETVLHHIVRGTGLTGLAGIPASRPLTRDVAIVRPLINVCRREVLEYLASIGQDFRTDASNVEPRFTRNRLRHELLPLLRSQYNDDVDGALVRLALQAREAQQVIGELAAELAGECVVTGRDVRIDCRPLRDQPSILIREVCRSAWKAAGWPQQAMGFVQWQQLADLVCGDVDSPSVHLPGNIRVRREASHLILEPPDLA
jgi:tRNA(Ile)-lysidine synthase